MIYFVNKYSYFECFLHLYQMSESAFSWGRGRVWDWWIKKLMIWLFYCKAISTNILNTLIDDMVDWQWGQ